MAVRPMEHVGVVVEDLAAAVAFFLELGLELEGEAPVEGSGSTASSGLDGVRVDVAIVRTPDGHGKLELAKFHAPAGAAVEPDAPANTPGIRHLLFAVDDLEDVLARLRPHGAELVGEVARYENSYLLLPPWPEGIIIELAQEL